MSEHFHELVIGACSRRLPIVTLASGARIAFMDIVGDIELLDAALREIAARLPAEVSVILGGDTVGMLVAHHMSILTGKPYVVARKKRTPVMTSPLTVQATSIAANAPSTFWLGQHQAVNLHGKHVLVIDEVASTGATLRALVELARKAGAACVTSAVIATEGVTRADVISVAHLPVWTDFARDAANA